MSEEEPEEDLTINEEIGDPESPQIEPVAVPEPTESSIPATIPEAMGQVVDNLEATTSSVTLEDLQAIAVSELANLPEVKVNISVNMDVQEVPKEPQRDAAQGSQESLSEPLSDQKCDQDNQILLSQTFHG